MKTFKAYLVAAAGLSIICAIFAFFNSRTSNAQGNPNPPGREVKVINAATEPVPVTGAVSITGTPSVSLTGDTSVRVTNFPAFPSSVTAARQNWEYNSFTFDQNGISQLTDRLNSLGGQGWELVSITPTPNLGANIVVLKRPR